MADFISDLSKYILYQNYCSSIRTVSSGPYVGEVNKFIFALGPKMS